MRPIVPFVQGVGASESDVWLGVLQAAASEHNAPFEIVHASSLTPDQAARVEVAIVANPEPTDLAKLPQLKWVHSLWAGVEKLMVNMPDPNVRVARLVDPCLADTMTEAALAWTLYLHRDMHRYAAQQKVSTWHQHPLRLADQCVVGILGLGEMGSASALRLAANGFNVVGWSRTEKKLDGVKTFCGDEGLSALLGQSDIVILLLPLTRATTGLINAARLSEMKAGAALINFARGAIVETDALIASLDRGALDHAILDVFTEEPLPTSSPLWSHEKITVLPHISAATNKGSAAKIVGNAIADWVESGALPKFADRTVGY
jgi:glyoxylate/hydroxypyruvate reductase